jgi:hypothetical protein
MDEIYEGAQKILKEHGKEIENKETFFNSLGNVILKLVFSGLAYIALDKIEFKNM